MMHLYGDTSLPSSLKNIMLKLRIKYSTPPTDEEHRPQHDSSYAILLLLFIYYTFSHRTFGSIFDQSAPFKHLKFKFKS